MENEYRYILEKGSKKHICPNCGKKTFVHYIDTRTSSYLPEQYGRCDRECNCAYWLNPYKDGYLKAILEQERGRSLQWQIKPVKHCKRIVPKRNTYYYPNEILEQSCSGYEMNIFIQNLIKNIPFPFDVQDVKKVINLYCLGTVKHGYRAGAITFPFIDYYGHVRAIQAKQFDTNNHTTSTDFLHSVIQHYYNQKNKPLPLWLTNYNENESKVSCLFGEHLLSLYPNNPIALVEAPKTAIIGTLYFGLPDNAMNLLWLAVYNISSINLNKCKILKGRNVVLFPDLSKDGHAFKLWKQKGIELQKQLPNTMFTAFDLLEQLASPEHRVKGYDIADYLINHDWRLYRKCSIL